MSETPVSVVETPRVVLRPPLRAYVAGSLVGTGCALLPYVAPDLVVPWQARRTTLALSAFGALALHALLHVACARREDSSWRRFVVASLMPGFAIALAASLVYAEFPEMRACAYAALVACAAASSLDLWEAAVLARVRPTRVRAVGRSLHFDAVSPSGSSPEPDRWGASTPVP